VVGVVQINLNELASSSLINTLIMETGSSSEASVSIHWPVLLYIPEDTLAQSEEC
jgi:hypothetical protein